MANSPGADAAYDRAIAAFDGNSYDVARRWALEALAQDPSHARARSLLSRLDAVRRTPAPVQTPFARPAARGGQPQSAGPEVVSTDPTVLISRASAPDSGAEPIEPTVLIGRDRARRPASDSGIFPPFTPPQRSAAPPVSEPTIIQRAARPPAPSAKAAAPRAGLVEQLRGWFGGSGAHPGSERLTAARPRSTAGLRGAGIVAAAVLGAALFLWGAIAAVHWFWPAGQLLTLSKPTGGTLTGPGLECGTRATDCSTTRPTGDPVELTPEPDAGYVFSGFTGDCAPAGRLAMTQPRTCGATFDKVANAPTAVTFPLTINKPVGGSIVGAGGILCGTLGSNCAANVPNGAPVTLHFEADTGFTFQTFTGDCAANGEMTMTAAKTCGATFMATSAPVANVVVPPVAAPLPRPRRQERTDLTPRPAPAPEQSAAPVSAPAPAPPPVSMPTNSDKPAPPPITAEDHARTEIQQLVRNYCADYETLNADRVQKLFPLAPMAVLRGQFKEYKTLQCTVTSPPEFERLDASPAGGAQVKFGMKQVIQMKSGGAPVVQETIATMVVSRTDLRNPWLIDRVRHELKPK